MQRRFIPLWLSLWLVASAGFSPVCRAQSQPVPPTAWTAPQPSAVAADELAIDEILKKGQRFESARDWANALVHYEESARLFPDHKLLGERLQLVRVHFDLARRYSDASFLAAARRLSTPEALDLFTEICLKIQSHYVEPPNWNAIVLQGARHLSIALQEPTFLKSHAMGSRPTDIAGFEAGMARDIQQRQINDRNSARDAVFSVAAAAEQHLSLRPSAVILEFVCGATGSLDEYSTFLSPGQLDDVYSQIEGNFVGLGVELKADNGLLLVTSVITGGPAEKAGMQAGDRIAEIDGRVVREMNTDQAADLLKGQQGSAVRLVLLDQQQRSRAVNVVRDRVEVPSVEPVKMLDEGSGIAYVKISSFQKTTSRDLEAALWKLHRLGMQSLIIDVRGNPGGLLTESVEIADKFVMSGTIVSTRGRSPREDFDYKAHQVGTWRVPLVVLIDEDSASASEIFAGAIHDHRRGTVVGHRSYGKGSVQGIFPLRIAQAGIRLTTAKFYSPNGNPISHHGVQPDVTVRADQEPAVASNDPILSAGLEAARQRVAQRQAIAAGQ
jgi:carboxyl-terminal processing protease